MLLASPGVLRLAGGLDCAGTGAAGGRGRCCSLPSCAAALCPAACPAAACCCALHLLQQEAGDAGLEVLGHALGGRVRAVRSAKRVVDVQVGVGGQLRRSSSSRARSAIVSGEVAAGTRAPRLRAPTSSCGLAAARRGCDSCAAAAPPRRQQRPASARAPRTHGWSRHSTTRRTRSATRAAAAGHAPSAQTLPRSSPPPCRSARSPAAAAVVCERTNVGHQARPPRAERSAAAGQPGSAAAAACATA